MKYGAALALAGVLTSVQAQRIDSGFLTGPELTALSSGNFAWGGIEIGDTSIMSLDYILAELDAITGDYPYNYYYPYAYYPPPLTVPRPIPGYPGLVNTVNIQMPSATIQFDALTRRANCSAPGGRIEYLNNGDTDAVEVDIRTQATFVIPLAAYQKNCQFLFFLGNTSTITGSGRFTVVQNNVATQQCPTTDPPTVPEVTAQTTIGTFQARLGDIATVVTTDGTFLVGENFACPAPGTVITLELRGWNDPLAVPSTIAWNGIFSGPAIQYTTPPPPTTPPVTGGEGSGDGTGEGAPIP